MADPLRFIDQFLLHFFADLIAERYLREVQLDKIPKDAGLNSKRPFAEKLISLIVLIIKHLHLIRKRFLLQHLHPLLVLYLIRNRRKKLLDNLLFLLLLAGCGLSLILIGLLLCDVVVLDELEVVETDHQEDAVDLVLALDDVRPFLLGA